MTTEKVAAATETTKAVIPPAREYIETDDGLTDEEREALADGGEEETTAAAGNEGEDEENGAENEADGESDQDGDAADAADDSGAALAPVAEAGETAAPAPAAPTQTVAPVLVVDASADFDAKLAEIATKKADALQKFDDGDITAREFAELNDTLGKEERKVEREADRVKLAADLQEQANNNAWVATVHGFVAAHPIYDARTNPRMNRVLDAEVRDVANTEEGKTMSGAAILAKAHANLVEAGMVKDIAAPAAAAKPARAPIPKKDLPPTLARVPATNVNDTEDNKYAALDRLQTTAPLEYEEKLMNMPESQRRAYEAA
jgi:hypothetical protein